MSLIQNFYGCQDYSPKECNTLLKMVKIIREQGEIMNLQNMDTPILEYKSLLLNKYGEEAENKLIFNLEKSGNNQGSLRYDQTVPLMRYVVQNKLDRLRRLQIGKVFRRDKPFPESGRFSEFYQADCDIIGNYDPVVTELEILWLIQSVLERIPGLENYEIRYNYRQNLVAICEKVGIKSGKRVKEVCTTIDKLDKIGWKKVKDELISVRNLSIEQTYELEKLMEENYLDSKMKDFDVKLQKYAKNPKLKFTASLARGLDYYTGLIYEVVVPGKGVKTIIAGGRYDRLIHMNSKKGKRYLPAIGVSFGLSRILMLVEKEKFLKESTKSNIYIVSKDLDMRMQLSRLFKDKGLIVDYETNQRKTIKSITFAVKNGFKYCAIYGESGEKIKIKELFNKETDKEYTLQELENLKID